MKPLKEIFPGLGSRYVRFPNGNKNRSFTKKGPGRVHQQGKPKEKEKGGPA